MASFVKLVSKHLDVVQVPLGVEHRGGAELGDAGVKHFLVVLRRLVVALENVPRGGLRV